MSFLNWLRVIVLGIVEGVTEWLPISSTGHLIILNELWKGDAAVFTADYVEMFDVIIQLGAILAVCTVFFHKLNPFSSYKTKEQKRNTWSLWGKVVIAVLPAAIVGVLFDDLMDEYLFKWYVVAIMLILVGAAFILVERLNRKDPSVMRFSQLSIKTALFIGCFQILSLIPGTSRSGITIIGALLLGCSRYIATEFTFYLAIPVMFGASALKLVKYFLKGGSFSSTQAIALAVAMVVAYVVSIFIIKFLVAYVKRHDFKAFGIYRIILGFIVIILFGLIL